MANSYGFDVHNRYAMFVDDEFDPLEVLKKHEEDKQEKKISKVAKKKNEGKVEPAVKGKSKKISKEIPNNKAPDNKREKAKSTQRFNTESKPDRNFNRLCKECREDIINRLYREYRQRSVEENSKRNCEERPRRNNLSENFDYRNRNHMAEIKQNGARARLSRSFDERRDKREFDLKCRADKTGVKAVEKRYGRGAHKGIIEEADKVNEDDSAWGDEKSDSGVAAVVKERTKPKAEPVPREGKPKEMTLDEWKVQRVGQQRPQYNLRKAGEGEDSKQWKKMYELNKKQDEEGLLSQDTDDEEYEAVEYPQRVGRQKFVSGINIHFNVVRRGGIARNFRANFEQRDENAQLTDIIPKVDDERDFPSLGKMK